LQISWVTTKIKDKFPYASRTFWKVLEAPCRNGVEIKKK
jgi:hypothetical protein